MEILHATEVLFKLVINWCILFTEFIGVTVLLITVVKSFIGYLKRSEHVRLELAQGIALALGFKLGGEVLRTLIVREWEELLVLGAIIVLRVALTLLIQWEIKNEKAEYEYEKSIGDEI